MDSRERAHTVRNVKAGTPDIHKKMVDVKERQGIIICSDVQGAV